MKATQFTVYNSIIRVDIKHKPKVKIRINETQLLPLHFFFLTADRWTEGPHLMSEDVVSILNLTPTSHTCEMFTHYSHATVII